MAEEEKPVLAELKPTGILCHVSQQDLETLKFHGTFGEYGPGEVVIEEGARQNRLYIVISGELQVSIRQGSKEIQIGTAEPGDCIGEISIFEPGTASATVKVKSTAVLWYLDVSSLQSYFEELPVAGGQLMFGIAQLLSKRLRQVDEAFAASQVYPKHLDVRSGRTMQPISRATFEEEKTGLLGIFKSKKDGSSLSTEIKM